MKRKCITLLLLLLLAPLLFSVVSVSHNSDYGCVIYTVLLYNSTTIQGKSLNYFSQLSPSSMTMDSHGNVYVAAVNYVFVLNSSGHVIKNISVVGADYLTYSNGLVIAASGVLPNYTLTFISAENFTVLRTVVVNDYPLSVAVYNNTIYIGTHNGIGELVGNKIELIVRTPGPVVSLIPVHDMLIAAGYNLPLDVGFVYFIFPSNKTVFYMVFNDTFPYSIYYHNGTLYIAADYKIIILNKDYSVNYIYVPNERIRGITVRENLIYATANSVYGPDYVLVLNKTTLLGRIEVGITPIGIIYNNCSNLIFVSNFFDGTVSIIGFNCNKTTSTKTFIPPQGSPETNISYATHGYYMNWLPLTIILIIVVMSFIIIFLVKRKTS